MFEPDDVRRAVADEVQHRSNRYVLLGVVALILGSIGLLYAGFVTITSVVVFGSVLIVAGLVQLAQALRWRDQLAISVQVPIGILELVVGAVMLSHPTVTILGLTLLLATFFVVSGLYRVIFAAAVRFPSWGWHVASGIVSLLLGALVWWEWPASSLWLLGAFVCVYCIATGWAYLMLGLVARSLVDKERGKPARPVPQPAV